MKLVLHPKVYSDIAQIMEYYEEVATPELADDFYRELRAAMVEAAARPRVASVRVADLRRVNLRRFPYHFLYRVVDDAVRVLVVRHHRRRPSVGVRRR